MQLFEYFQALTKKENRSYSASAVQTDHKVMGDIATQTQLEPITTLVSIETQSENRAVCVQEIQTTVI